MPGEQAFLLAGFFLLLTAAGWSIRYLWERDRPRDNHQYLNVEYLKGLNFLLNEQTDQAVDLFLRMVRVDDETIETHFALGSLFRRRGEVDRAIRIHQNIIARPGLPEEQRQQALYSLARDYMTAGLLDRAESLFLTLAEQSDYRNEALSYLARIYVQERDWQKAVDVGRQLEPRGGDETSRSVAHYHCELAEQAIERGDFSAARQFLRDAQSGRGRTTRGTLIRAELAERTDDRAMAYKLYWRVISENPDLIVEVLPRLHGMYASADKLATLEKQLSDLVRKQPEIVQSLAYVAVLYPDLKSDVLQQCLSDYVQNEPTLADFIDVSRLEDGKIDSEALLKVKTGLAKLATKTPKYRCSECGFSSMSLLWHCPSCKSWETQRPANQVRFDSLVRGGRVDW
ncbi:MAG: lipopolysaccharide assembly protein LapB [Pseudomonadota bacterium]